MNLAKPFDTPDELIVIVLGSIAGAYLSANLMAVYKAKVRPAVVDAAGAPPADPPPR